MDKKIANNLIVGIFVLVGMLGFVFVLFNIGEGRGLFNRQLSLFGKFTGVKGLNFGSEVSLAGLRVGTVKKISISPGDSKELIVEMTVGRDMFDRIRQDSVATIKTSGMLGDKYIEISIGSPTAPPMKSGEFIVTEEPPDLFSKSGKLVENIASEFRKGGDFQQLIHNLNVVSQNLASVTTEMRSSKGLMHEVLYGSSGAKLNSGLDHLNKGLANLEEVTRKINAGQGSLGALINDPTVYEDLKDLMGGARRSTVLKYFMRSFIDSGGQQRAAPPAPPAKK